MAQQITRIPLKYWPILNKLSSESVGNIFKNILGWNENLNEIEQIYFDLVMTDIWKIDKKAWDWNRGWRPKNKPKVIVNDKPKVMINDKPKVSSEVKPSTVQLSTVQINTDKLKEEIESENLNDFLPHQELDKFIAHRTEPFQRWVMKWKQKREWEKTRNLTKRMTTWKNNYETNFWKIKPKSTDPTSRDYFEWYKQNIDWNEKFEDPLQPWKMVTYSQNNYQYYLVNKHWINKQEAIKIKDKFLDI